MDVKRLPEIARSVSAMYLSRLGIRWLPYSLFWYVTWRCNSRCLHCEFGKSGTGSFMNDLRGDELPLEDVKKGITEAKSWGARHMAFAGGEPFIREDFLEIIRHCKKEGYVVGVSTNGYLLANEDFASKVLATGVDRIDISLDSPGKLHDDLRGVSGAFDLVNQAIANLHKGKKSYHFYLGINTVVSGFNYRQLPAIFEYAAEKHLDGVGLQPFHYTQARAKELIPSFLLNPQQISELKIILAGILNKYGHLLKNSSFFVKNIASFYENQHMPKFSCYGGWQEAHIFPDGTVGICCFNRIKSSLRDKNLRELLLSDEFKEAIQKAKVKDCPGCWSPPVHEYNLLFKPKEILSAIELLKIFLRWTKK